jgi:hypothetical protein
MTLPYFYWANILRVGKALEKDMNRYPLFIDIHGMLQTIWMKIPHAD